MKFHYTNLDTCHTATGVVIVVDVLRAFSTAAYAFSRGAEKIILVSDVDETLSLKSQIPNSKAMGEVRGLPPEGFDYGNSPTQIREQNLSGITLIQRTGAGTQGAVRCKNADVLLASSFVLAGATVKYVQLIAPTDVTFVITGETWSGGDEDLACAEYLERRLKGQNVDTKSFIQRVYDCNDAVEHLDPERPEFPVTDLEYCTDINAFDFAMLIENENDLLTTRKTKI
ncbi:MAG TPA: 2-phosphosulfolactate phosphatase [Anaerolineales bacterium]|nr:2-phosphosulfolactate phosphatase [Anaerolineales bacterium]